MENPLDIIDRTVSTYAGGMNTDTYYAQIYANQQHGVLTETIVIDAAVQKNSAQVQQRDAAGQYQTSGTVQQNQTIEPIPAQSESPIDVFLRTTAPGAQNTPSTAVQPVATTQQTTTTAQSQYTQTVGAASTKIAVTPTGAFGFVVSAAFSVAVVISVIGLMFIVYIIIRTRQLHHHEHHVKELGGHGPADVHAKTHESTHAPVAGAHAEDDDHTEIKGSLDDSEEQDIIDNDIEDAVPAFAAAAVTAPETFAPTPPIESLTNDEATLYSSRLKTIKDDAAGDDEDAWYTALMDVNLFLEDILGERGYEGTTVKEMLQDDETKTLATRDVALEAEAEFQKLISGEKPLTQDAIVALVNMYAKVCKELGVN
jgi:hypothetical protein